MRLSAIWLLLIGWGAGCADVTPSDEGSSTNNVCTLIGCSDGVSVKIHPRNDSWQFGSYSFEFTFSNTRYWCSINIPEGVSTNPSVSSLLPCAPDLPAHFLAEKKCDMSAGVAQTDCDSIDDKWLLYLNVDETPEYLTVRMKRDNNVIFDREITPTYSDVAPNGPRCGPVCNVGAFDLIFDE